MEVSQIITLLSGAGLGAILSAILVFVNNSKRNQLDYITRERSEWRKDIQTILDDLGKVGKRVDAIQRLKSRINPYGKELTDKDKDSFYLHEGHIWRLVNGIDILSAEQIEELSDFVRFLWKYDWERSKREIKLDIFKSFIYFILIVSSLSNSLLILFKIDDLSNRLILTLSSFFMIVNIFFFGKFIKQPKKPIFKIFYIALLCTVIYQGIYYMLYWLIPHKTKDFVSLFVAFLIFALTFSIEVNIISNINSEEKKYIASLKAIEDRRRKK